MADNYYEFTDKGQNNLRVIRQKSSFRKELSTKFMILLLVDHVIGILSIAGFDLFYNGAFYHCTGDYTNGLLSTNDLNRSYSQNPNLTTKTHYMVNGKLGKAHKQSLSF